jgi:hypothetical protein
VKPYGEMGLVRIGANAKEFGEAIRQSLQEVDGAWLERVDGFLAEISWDKTFEGMWKEIQRVMPPGPASSAINTEKLEGANADV